MQGKVKGNVRQRGKGWQADFRHEGQRIRNTLDNEAAG